MTYKPTILGKPDLISQAYRKAVDQEHTPQPFSAGLAAQTAKASAQRWLATAEPSPASPGDMAPPWGEGRAFSEQLRMNPASFERWRSQFLSTNEGDQFLPPPLEPAPKAQANGKEEAA